MYWDYRNLKAVKNAQKNDISLFWSAFFMGLTSINVFRSIAHSAKLVNYTKKLRPVLSAWLFLFFFGGSGYNSRNKTEEEITVEVAFMIILIAVVLGWLFITLLTLLVNKYQKAIRFYCEQKGLPSVKGFTFWEIILIILGVLINLWLILFTFLVIRAFL